MNQHKNVMHILKSLLKNKKTWTEIYEDLVHLDPSGVQAGFLFEFFAKQYFELEPSISGDYKNVWLFKECPDSIKERLGFSSIDRGVDLILENRDGKLTCVQCKFRIDQEESLSWSKDKIANLFAESDKADYFCVFTNASSVDKYSIEKKGEAFFMIVLGDLLNINSDTILKMSADSAEIVPIVAKPRDYQQKAIDLVVEGFKKADRGQLILPCGAGKTLTSLWLREKLDFDRNIVLVPSLALLRQIKNEWHVFQGEWTPYLCVCSENDIDLNNDSLLVHTFEIGGNVSTSVEEIRSFLMNHKKFVLYSTYHSLDLVMQAAKESGLEFDLAICDEAHKTAGYNKSFFGLIHSDANIKVKKRLYMTATPRIVSAAIKRHLEENGEEYLADMSNEEVFGKQFYRMSFGEAIEKGILVDYKIVAVGVTDSDIQKLIHDRKYAGEDFTIEDLANNYALEKIMTKYNATHAITFHSTIKNSVDFAKRHRALVPATIIEVVTGKQSTNHRNVLMDKFKNADRAIMSNARCLTEGINVPTIDLVYFCDPKNSKVDIVQASGRALRKAVHKDKKIGFIVVPIYHRAGEDLETVIEESSFNNLISVVRALCDQDERLQIEINNIVLNKGERRINSSHRLSLEFEDESLIVFDDLADKLKSSLFDEIIERSSQNWEIYFFKLKDWLEMHSNVYPMVNSENVIEKSLYQWVGLQRGWKKKNKLRSTYVAKLDSIDFIWDKRDFDFLNRLNDLKEFLAKNGRYPVQRSKDKNESRLAVFCQDKRTKRRKGELREVWIKKLDELNFIWDPYEYSFESNAKQLADFISKNQALPSQNGGEEEKQLAAWMRILKNKLIKGDLDDSKKELLKLYAIDLKSFENDLERKEWLINYESLKEIKLKFDRWPNSRASNVTENPRFEGNLSGWFQRQRELLKENLLEKWKKELLDALGDWCAKTDITSYDDLWLDKFEQLRLFVKENHRFPTKMDKGTLERKLTMWVGFQRNLFCGRLKNYSKLSPDRIELLESIGIDWGGKIKRQSFEDRYIQLQNWVTKNKCLPSGKRDGSEESLLANWLVAKRQKIKQGKLDQEKIEKLKVFDSLITAKPQKTLKSFESSIEDLKSWIKNTNGVLPRLKKDGSEESKLAQWISNTRQRFKQNRLTKEQIELLNSHGLIEIIQVSQNLSFDERVIQLKRWLEETHGLLPKLKNDGSEESNLAQWIANTKQRFKKGKLTVVQMAVLKQFGIII